MQNDPSWEDLFNPTSDETARPSTTTATPVSPDVHLPPSAPGQPTRRELREQESGGRSKRTGGDGPKRRRRGWLWVLVTLLVLGLLGSVAVAYVWANYETQVRKVLGWELANDYAGAGNGEEVVVVIQSGDIGGDVARTLEEAGVTMTFDAFYDLLLSRPDISFVPGNFTLQKEMSAQSALDALLDPANRITNRVTIPEGTAAPDALVLISQATGIPLEELQAAAADYVALGVPADAPNIEGFLFPATYPLEPGQGAQEILQVMVTEMIDRLDALGVAPEDRLRVVTLASIVQREAGPNQDDFPKIARVFVNRLETDGWLLQSDATVAYGTGNLHTVWTSDAERADASNPYNTYANPGLPVGPIGLPGQVALDAAINPADGPWFFFVPVDLKSGETVFSETASEHEAAADRLRAWCKASAENQAYCK